MHWFFHGFKWRHLLLMLLIVAIALPFVRSEYSIAQRKRGQQEGSVYELQSFEKRTDNLPAEEIQTILMAALTEVVSDDKNYPTFISYTTRVGMYKADAEHPVEDPDDTLIAALRQGHLDVQPVSQLEEYRRTRDISQDQSKGKLPDLICVREVRKFADGSYYLYFTRDGGCLMEVAYRAILWPSGKDQLQVNWDEETAEMLAHWNELATAQYVERHSE